METVKRAFTKNDLLRVISIKPFSLMMFSELFSQFAFNMQNFILIFLVYTLTRSNTAVSGIILSFTIPAVLLSVIGGVYVDRWDKRKVMFYVSLLRGFLILLLLIPNIHLSFIYIVAFSIAIATQFFIPAEAALIPLLVPKKLILSANSVFTAGIYGTIFLGYILSGPTLLLIGKNYTIIFLSALFFLGALFIFFVKPSFGKEDYAGDVSTENEAEISFAKEMREIFSFIKETKKVMNALVVITIAQAVILMFMVLGPGYLSTILKVEVESLSFILIAPAAIGTGIAVLLLGSVGKKFKLKHLSALGFLVSGIMFALFPFMSRVTASGFTQTVNQFLPHILAINNLHIVVLLAGFIGFAFSFIFIPSNATIQLETNGGIRGRIFGFLNALIGAVAFLPIVLAGGIADILGIGIVMVSVGVIMSIVGIIFFVFE